MPRRSYRFQTGLDLRRNPADSDPSSLRIATNFDLTPGGKLQVRDALVKVADLHPESVGLFSVGGDLHTVVPGGHGIQDLRPAGVIYDPIGPFKGVDSNGDPIAPTAYPLGELTRLRAMETIGSSTVAGAFPYVVLERTDGKFEHHWLTESVPDSNDPVETQVSLPFDPGATLAKIAGKLTADDPANGLLRMCSTLNGPRDWTLPRDAAFLAVGQNAIGSRTITGQGIFNRRLAVFFEDAVQIWNITPDPANITLENTLNGPGTTTPGLIENVLGDLMYFSNGGFRSLSVVDLAGQTREGDVGTFIQAETDLIDLTTIVPYGFWSQARSQYIGAFGDTVYAFTNSVVSRTRGWTKWKLPVTVDYIVEHKSDVFIRSGNTLYKLANDVDTDHGDVDIDWQLRTQFLDGDAVGVNKRWAFFNLAMTGSAQVNFLYDSGDLTKKITGPFLQDTTYQSGLTPVMCMSEMLALELIGSGRFDFDAATFNYDVLRFGV